MSDSCSSPIINNDQSVPLCNTENSSTDENINVLIFANGTRSKRKMTSEQYHQLNDKLLEIEQIKCEERLVHEQLDHLNQEKQYVQNLLDILHMMDSEGRMNNSRSRPRRLKKFHSKSDLN
jgi:predicted alpha/beta superfamily hydrolase